MTWYDDAAILREAISRAIEGYKGQVAARWHVIPVAFKKFAVREEVLVTTQEHPETPLELRAGDQGGGLFDVDDAVVTRRILRVGAMVGEDDADFLYGMNTFTYIKFDIEDAAGVIFPFDMVMNEGDGDANTGFFAVVWIRTFGHDGAEVAHCTTCGDLETRIRWLDESILHRYVPHQGLCPSTTDKHLTREVDDNTIDRDLHREFFESSLGYSGLEVSFDDDRNQLELLMAVAAKLNEKPALFPTVVPQPLLEKATSAYLKDVLRGVPTDVWQCTGSYLASAIFYDQDGCPPFRDVDQWD
ncbi:hypothetical protein H257_09363 [Aphanomyces astaci]|uniref:Uncharacterized protein n=1 Tax=Aphanomyces astaci TaxID=112090 RepID=W4GDB1_APHAT|nr:hypothetical protein H257_09363 [Aphanomyces astaci]ETV76953.1 hypothetical protein H257_09363 [Aphanomyces astaci]RQM28921.1 hypothetical protein B5M09_004781 [Aphanomyces astaci]|eukprot:XP_009833865.1 hypothetical protein H257_09363 [Aphanomyces astaci]